MKQFDKWQGKESDFQRVAARYLDALSVLWCHCPNGGQRDSDRKKANKRGAALRSEGTKKGFPDIAIYEPRGSFHGLFIELKRDGGKMSVDQELWLNKLYERGYQVAKTDSVDELIEIVEKYLKQ